MFSFTILIVQNVIENFPSVFFYFFRLLLFTFYYNKIFNIYLAYYDNGEVVIAKLGCNENLLIVTKVLLPSY